MQFRSHISLMQAVSIGPVLLQICHKACPFQHKRTNKGCCIGWIVPRRCPGKSLLCWLSSALGFHGVERNVGTKCNRPRGRGQGRHSCRWGSPSRERSHICPPILGQHSSSFSCYRLLEPVPGISQAQVQAALFAACS